MMFGGGQWVGVGGHIDEKQCVYFPRMKVPTEQESRNAA